MPIFDVICQSCDWTRRDAFEHHGQPTICPNGHETEHLWDTARTPTVVDDSWPGGKTFQNMGHDPVTCYSRTEYRMQLQARGLEEFVRHQPIAGTDKSPHTSSWSTMSTETLDNARKLLERVTG